LDQEFLIRILILNKLLYLFKTRIKKKSKKKTSIEISIIILVRESRGVKYKNISKKILKKYNIYKRNNNKLYRKYFITGNYLDY
jgi:surface polysaccharide O-acyltransferase-like enzyme